MSFHYTLPLLDVHWHCLGEILNCVKFSNFVCQQMLSFSSFTMQGQYYYLIVRALSHMLSGDTDVPLTGLYPSECFLETLDIHFSESFPNSLPQLPLNCYQTNFQFQGFTITSYITFDVIFYATIKYLAFVILMHLSADRCQFLCLSVLNKTLPIF